MIIPGFATNKASDIKLMHPLRLQRALARHGQAASYLAAPPGHAHSPMPRSGSK